MRDPTTPDTSFRAASLLGSPLRRVVAVNVVLLAVLVSMSIGPGAGAQPTGAPLGGASRARGDYTMISGKTNTGNTNAVYVLDAANQELLAVRWDASRQKLVTVGYRNLDADAKAPPTR